MLVQLWNVGPEVVMGIQCFKLLTFKLFDRLAIQNHFKCSSRSEVPENSENCQNVTL